MVVTTMGRVLVVDDDTALREAVAEAIADAGYEVEQAENGRDALAKMRRDADERPCIVLLDLMMPVMDGFEFIAEFHRHPEWQGIPVVVITAKNITREDRERLAVSARTVLQKSGFTQEDLLGKVLELVRQHAQGNTNDAS